MSAMDSFQEVQGRVWGRKGGFQAPDNLRCPVSTFFIITTTSLPLVYSREGCFWLL